MKVYWADRAKHRLTAIHDDISEKPSSSAGKTVRKIIARSRQIAEHPPAGRKTPNINEMTAEKCYLTLVPGNLSHSFSSSRCTQHDA